MQVVSPAFLAEVRKSHTIISYVEIETYDHRTFRLDAIGGGVTIDRSAETRRRCSIDCVDRTGTLTPVSVHSVLTPYGTTLRVYRGVRYTTGVLAGSEEVVPLGVFQLSSVDVADSTGGSPKISLEAYDYSRKIKRDKFIEPYTVAQDTNVIDAIKAIIKRTLQDIDYDTITSAVKVNAPLVFDANSDPWDACTQLAQSAGCEIFFTATGKLKVAPPVDIDHLPAPQFTFVEGPNCTMEELSLQFSDEPGYNGVILVGESAGDETAPVRSVVWDNEPSSPTYYKGPYGAVPMFVTDQTITTQEAADTAAKAQLNQILGGSSQLQVKAGVNPALDINDVVEVERERLGVSGVYAIDSVTVPLSADGRSDLSVRQKRVV